MPLDEQSAEDKEYVCDGLKWALHKGIDARNFTFSIRGSKDKKDHLTDLLFKGHKRAMAMHIIQRCMTRFYFGTVDWWDEDSSPQSLV